MSKSFQYIDITDEEMATLIQSNDLSAHKLTCFIQYWHTARATTDKTAPGFGSTAAGVWTGKWHRKLTNDDIQFMTAVLRHNHCHSTKSYSEYELNFIQGIEDLARSGAKRNNKQGWQLAMILEEKIV